MNNTISEIGPHVHVWRVALQAEEHTVAKFEKILFPEELARADGFRFPYLRRRFIIARGSLRIILARYLRTDPNRLPFSYGPSGKPYVHNSAEIRFNISHSDDLAMLAFASHCDLGVDVEHIRSSVDVIEIARRFFHKAEFADLVSVPANKREEAFALCWTRKEACVKAAGSGLLASLDAFHVTLRPGEPAQVSCLLSNDGNLPWSMQDLSDIPNYAAALVYQDRPRCVNVSVLADASELLE